MIHINCCYRHHDKTVLVLNSLNDNRYIVVPCQADRRDGTPEMLMKGGPVPTGEPFIVDQSCLNNAEFLNKPCEDCIYLKKSRSIGSGSADSFSCGLRVGFDQINEYRRGMFIDCEFHTDVIPECRGKEASSCEVKKTIRQITEKYGVTEIESQTYCITPFILNKLLSMLDENDDVYLCSGIPLHEHLLDYARDKSLDEAVLSYKAKDFSYKEYCFLHSEASEILYEVIVFPALNCVIFGCETLLSKRGIGYSVSAPMELTKEIVSMKRTEDDATSVDEDALRIFRRMNEISS